MSKKHNTQKHELVAAVEVSEPTPVFDTALVAKITRNGEVVFVGTLEGAALAGLEFSMEELTPLTDDERVRFDAVSAQTTLGMGNIIDAVVNG